MTEVTAPLFLQAHPPLRHLARVELTADEIQCAVRAALERLVPVVLRDQLDEPQVDAQGHVRAKISSEVSSIDRSVTTLAGPALLTRKAQTEFNVRAGETIVLAGPAPTRGRGCSVAGWSAASGHSRLIFDTREPGDI